MSTTRKPIPPSADDGARPETTSPEPDAAAPEAAKTGGGEPVAPARDDLGAPAPAPDPLELYRTRRERAAAIRGRTYHGRLTAKMLAALEPLLEEPTPDQYKQPLGRHAGSRREPTATVSLYYQLRMMDDTLTRAHWRYLTHYEDGGSTARVFVVIGNRLAGVALDETTGALAPGEHAEILFARDGWGGVKEADSKGDLLKSSQTSALRRLLGQIGPGRDVLESPVPQDGGAGDPAAAPAVVPLPRYRADLTAAAGAGDRKASELQVKMLLGIARQRGLPPSQLANLIGAAAGVEPEAYASETDAQRFVDAKLSERLIVLPFDLVTPLKCLLEQASPQPPVLARPPAGTPTGGSDQDAVPFDPSGAEAA